MGKSKQKTDKKLESIGQFLMEERQKKKLTIEEISTKTKININVLKALEANDIENLPNITYVKGFVKNYAKIVGADQEYVIELLNRAYSPEEPQEAPQKEEVVAEVIEVEEKKFVEPKKVAKSQEENKNKNKNKISEDVKEAQTSEAQEQIIKLVHSYANKKTFITISSVIIVVVIIKLAVSFIGQLSSEQLAFVKEPNKQLKILDKTIKTKDANIFDMKTAKKLEDQTKAKETAEEKQQAKAKAKENKKKLDDAKKLEEDKLTKAKEKEKKIAQAKKAAAAKKLELKLNGKFPFMRFYPAPLKMYEVLVDAPENKNTELLPNRFKNAVESDKQNVFIHAQSGDTWISYQSDENAIKRFVLKQGRSVLIKGDSILLFLGNLNVAKIFYNNQLIKTSSRTGVKSLIFPQRNAEKFELPLFPSYKGIPYKASIYKSNMAEEVANI